VENVGEKGNVIMDHGCVPVIFSSQLALASEESKEVLEAGD